MAFKNFTIKEVRPKIFHLNFKDQYQLAMHFLRYQEMYESPNPKFRNGSFTIFEFMEWYSKKFGNGNFTYPTDWIGFNIPSYIVERAVYSHGIYDKNHYDKTMWDAWTYCNSTLNKGRPFHINQFYIIGSVGSEGGAMKHEIAHGFFYTNPEYKKEMTKLVKQLKKPLYKKMCEVLKRIGYTSHVYIDECQAYLSTGVPKNFGVKLRGEDKPFIELYNRYYNV